MRSALILVLATLATGCAPTALQLAHDGRFLDAFDALDAADEPTKQRVLRSIVAEEAPTLTIEAIEGEALGDLVGGPAARTISPGWILLHTKVQTRARVLPYPSFVVEIGQGRREVPSFAMVQLAGIVAATGERIPDGHMAAEYKSDFCESVGFFFCVVLAPISIASIHKTGEHFVGPSPDEVRREAPIATRLITALADRCGEPGVCDRYLLLRRPLREDDALFARARVALRRRPLDTVYDPTDDLSIIGTARIPDGHSIAARLPIKLAVGQIPEVELTRHEQPRSSIHFCAGWQNADLAKGGGKCLVDLAPLTAAQPSEIGLAMPLPPASLATPKESAAARPWWAGGAVYAPGSAAPSKESQAPAADTELVRCQFDVPALSDAWARLDPPGGDAWVRLNEDVAVIPLAHLKADGSVRVEVWNDSGGKREMAGSAALERRGAAIVPKKIQAARGWGARFDKVACTPFDRAAVEAELRARWAPAVEALDLADEAVTAFHPDILNRDFGFPRPRVEAAEAAILEVAALVGWSDPRAEALVMRIRGIRARANGLVKSAIAARLGDKRDTSVGMLDSLRDYEIKIVGVHASEAAPASFDVDITASKQHGGEVIGQDLDIALDSGQLVPAYLPAGLSLAPGETKRVVVSPDARWRVPPGARSWALVQRHFMTTWIHLPP